MSNDRSTKEMPKGQDAAGADSRAAENMAACSISLTAACSISLTADWCRRAASIISLMDVSGVVCSDDSLSIIELALSELKGAGTFVSRILRLELCECIAKIVSEGNERQERRVFHACKYMHESDIKQQLVLLFERSVQVMTIKIRGEKQ